MDILVNIQKTNQLLIVTAFISLASFSSNTFALRPKDITPAEMALLPSFCADVQGFKYGDAYYRTSPYAKKWVAMMGKGFWHMHHYCWAIINYNRAMRISFPRAHRNAALKDARGDFYYVVNNTENDFILLPEIYTWIGRISVVMKEAQEAETAFVKAKTLKEDYWPAYFHHGELLLRQGKKVEAMETVKSGLRHAPKSKSLLALFNKLGGKLADIPPRVKAQKPAVEPEVPVEKQTDIPAQSAPRKPD